MDILDLQALMENNLKSMCDGKKVVIYGTGKGFRQFLDKYGDKIIIDGIVDNDTGKQGKLLEDLFPEAFQTKCGNICIHGIEILPEYCSEKTVFFVASAKQYAEIARDLRHRGFKYIYVISNSDEYGQKVMNREGLLERRQAYIKNCLNEPINPKKILLFSFSDYADHEKYISDALMRLRPDLDIVWLVSNLDTPMPNEVRKVLWTNWKKALYEAETAAIWIADVAVPEYWIKRQEQIYIQTKHWASITLKKFYLDAATFQSEPGKIAPWIRESSIIDYIIVGSEFDLESCKRGFGVDGKFIMIGSPRSDGLFRGKENRDKVYRSYGLAKDVRVLMYAPTYRFDREKGKSVHQSREIGFDYQLVKTALENRFGGNWLIALRLHPSVAAEVKNMKFPDFVFDVSAYADSEELVAAFDILVSDFSSIMFEPAFVKKPVFLFAKDISDYIENEYELLIDYRELPFAIAENTEQLCENILNFNKEGYEKNLGNFLKKYSVCEDGHASERAAGFISGLVCE